MVKGSVGLKGCGRCGIVAFVCGGRINVGCDGWEKLCMVGFLAPGPVSSGRGCNALLKAAAYANSTPLKLNLLFVDPESSQNYL